MVASLASVSMVCGAAGAEVNNNEIINTAERRDDIEVLLENACCWFGFTDCWFVTAGSAAPESLQYRYATAPVLCRSAFPVDECVRRRSPPARISSQSLLCCP